MTTELFVAGWRRLGDGTAGGLFVVGALPSGVEFDGAGYKLLVAVLKLFCGLAVPGSALPGGVERLLAPVAAAGRKLLLGLVGVAGVGGGIELLAYGELLGLVAVLATRELLPV
jgi:hypothetical protein